MVVILCLLTLYLVLKSAGFILSRLYWSSWKPATAMMGLMVAAYACKKAVDIPVSAVKLQSQTSSTLVLSDSAFAVYNPDAEKDKDNTNYMLYSW